MRGSPRFVSAQENTEGVVLNEMHIATRCVAALVDHYDGSWDTIVGLPAERLIQESPDLLAAEVK